MRSARDVSPATARLAIVRVGVLAGVLAIGAVAFWQHRQPGWTRANMQDLKPLRGLGMGAWSLSVVGIIALRMKFARAIEAGTNSRLQVIGWALGELPALFGGVYYYLTDDATIYLAGIGAMVVAFTLFPATRR